MYDVIHSLPFRDSLIVTMANSVTSVFSGFVVFSALGYMAHTRNLTIEDLAIGGHW